MKRILWCGFFLIGLAGLVLNTVHAGETSVPNTTITLNGSGQTVESYLASISKQAGVEIITTKSFTSKMDVCLKDVGFESAMNTVCDLAGLEWGLAEPVNKSSSVKHYLVKEVSTTPTDDPTKPISDAVSKEPSPTAASVPPKDPLKDGVLVKDRGGNPGASVVNYKPGFSDRVEKTFSKWNKQSAGTTQLYAPGYNRRPRTIRTPSGVFTYYPAPHYRKYHHKKTVKPKSTTVK